MKRAKKFIFIEFFIIADGYMWDEIHKILLERLQNGVEIKIIFDDFGSANRQHKNFVKVVNTIMGTDLILDEMLETYKSRHLNTKIVSSTTVLYRSNAFSSTLGIIEDNENKPQIDTTQKIGRNDPCPCGSGKKYKKCC